MKKSGIIAGSLAGFWGIVSPAQADVTAVMTTYTNDRYDAGVAAQSVVVPTRNICVETGANSVRGMTYAETRLTCIDNEAGTAEYYQCMARGCTPVAQPQ